MKVKNNISEAKEEVKQDADTIVGENSETLNGGEADKSEAKEEVKQDADTIPEYVDKLLKLYSNYAQLMVDAKGGVYVEGTKHSTANNLILYKNPYYKS